MCDGYSQSTQHARVVAWLERGPVLVWLPESTIFSGFGDVQPPVARRGVVQKQGLRPHAQAAWVRTATPSIGQSATGR